MGTLSTETVRNIFDSENFMEVRRPALEASTLPAYCYTSPEWYQREIEHIFMREWLLVGRAEQLPNVGDYFVEDIVGQSVLIVRGQDQRLRAFSPFCRHRGTKLISGAGNCKAFVCPYHRWIYSLHGELLGAPEMHQTKDFNRSDYGLIPIRLENWAGFLFVNFDPEAVSLSEFLGDLPAKLAKYRPEELVLTRQKTYVLECNWKVYVDNSIECYHVPSVHRSTIEEYAPMEIWTCEEAHGAYLMLYGMFPGTLALLKDDKGFLPIEGLPRQEIERHDLPWVLPNTHFLCTVDTFWWLTMFPEGPEQMRVVVNSSFPKKTTERPDFEEVAARYYKRLDTTNPEDNRIAELQQKGLRLRLNSPGRFSYHEKLVHAFANYIVDRVVGSALR